MRFSGSGRDRLYGLYGLAVVLALGLTSCVDTQQVFVDRPIFSTPPTAAANFVGKSDTLKNLPACGNCHIGQNAQWKETGHAKAWATLVASGGQQASCEPCHSVSDKGNQITNANVGWPATHDARYKDVQCESCHGPGLDHMTNPDNAPTRPLASIKADTLATNGCGECHSGVHEPFVNEWQKSKHGAVEPVVLANVKSNPATYTACLACHSAQGALAAWGITANYVEKSDAPANHLGITCAVCHDPHDATNPKQLRFPINVASEEQNLCVKCHHNRSVPDPAASSRGPHSPEGPLLFGTAGWWPPNMPIGNNNAVPSTHGSAANPGLCATCHVSRLTVTDKATGKFVFQATGHLFEAIPCLNAQGIPTADDCPVSQRSFRSCTASGCHGSEAAARSAFTTATTRLQTLNTELLRLIALVPASELNANDGKYTTAEGAKFNSGFMDATKPGSPVHNPFLVEALLTASIAQLKKDYNVKSDPSISLENVLRKHPN